MSITVRVLATLKPGDWLTEAGNRNEGALRAKGGPNGARLYYRYRDSAGRYDDLPIGTFDEKGKRGLTLELARKRVGELRTRYLSGERDLRAVLGAEQREAERLREVSKSEADARVVYQQATLGALLTAYVEQLRRDGKPSARSVERSIQRHIEEAWPTLCASPVAEVTTDDLLAVIARVADADKLREAAKVRSYLTAAYAAGLRARQDARGLPALRELRITSNPARDLVTIEGATKARERALSLAELRAYWKRLVALPDPAGALLRFHLLTGGQRIEQLGRLTLDDYDSDVKTIRLRDGKGRRKVARIHDVPLIPQAIASMAAMKGGAIGPSLFTVTGGESGAVYGTVQHRIREVAEAMAEAGELEKGLFTAGDLRRTVETRLAATGVSAEVRAQLQSHGLGGIQARHYDRHDYLVEKRAALETLHRLVTGSTANVTPIKHRARR
jgi:hypothetical protein